MLGGQLARHAPHTDTCHPALMFPEDTAGYGLAQCHCPTRARRSESSLRESSLSASCALLHRHVWLLQEQSAAGVAGS
eukprot:363316-Chlamydomonas_euryale.AAC.14